MNTKHYQTLMTITRKNVSSSWATEQYEVIGTIRGSFNPISGGMVTIRGKVDTAVTHQFYCPANADVKTGDILIDTNNNEYVAMFTQSNGISGRGDHMEISLEARA